MVNNSSIPYKKNYLSSQINEHKERPRHMPMENPGTGLTPAHKSGGV